METYVPMWLKKNSYKNYENLCTYVVKINEIRTILAEPLFF
jgi:hypothetical protein